jgi:tRNA-specific 2-thiouridylase
MYVIINIMKVVVAMSGGVDSSVSAYLLKMQGYDVVGLSLQLWDRRGLEGANRCCSVETIEIAKAIARRIGIEHHVVDVRDAFYRYVIEEFCNSYVSGLTPNPCILCNRHIKFDFLLMKARELGAGMIATGHYARIKGPSHGSQARERFLLMKGQDQRKDQSYVLYVMTQEQLSKTIFPLGGLTKDRTREIAREAGLENALRAESQEICFVGEDGYGGFIRHFSEDVLREGQVVDINGEVLGVHKGIAFYTVGQRKGLNIPSKEPLYVIAIDAENNRIIAGPRERAFKKTIRVRDLNWISVDSLSGPMRVSVKIRSTMADTPAMIFPLDGERVLVEFDEPQWAPAPGQSAVFYSGDVVVGGGVIE